MPRKSKGKFKPYKNNTSYAEAEVFRNSSAVLDDTDPYESLKYMKDIFKDKLDEDVINMIFSECAYNVDQAFETLMSLCNEEDVPHHLKDGKLRKNAECSRPVAEGIDINSNLSACELSNSCNLPKPTKSKLAINFSLPSKCSLELPYENTKSTILENNEQFTSGQNQNTDLSCNYTLNRLESSSLPAFPENYTSNELTNSFGNIFSTSFCSSPGNTSSSTDVTDSISVPSKSLACSAPQFITPHLPTPVYKYGSSNCTPRNHTRNTFWDLSKNLHVSSPKTQNAQKKQTKVKEAAEKIKSGSHILVIIRGLPGSGKSSLARKLKFSGEILSTDDFFIKRGEYIFDPFKLGEAHAWNKRRAKKALEKGVTPVIIDNTNVEAWEITPYVLMGKKYNYEIFILEPDTPWKFNVHQLYLRNKHGVPKSKIAKMKERYQHNITVENLLASIDLLDLKNIDNFSDDSECNKIVVKNEEGKIVDILDHNVMKNSISLEADIHQEEVSGDTTLFEETAFEPNLPRDNSLFPPCSNDVSFKSDNSHSFNGCELKENSTEANEHSSNVLYDSSVSKQSIEIRDLDDLRALAEEDSEDSQSLYSSENGSLQDISCWEAITERDDDFLWSRYEEIKTSTLPSDKDNSGDFMNLQMSHLNFRAMQTSLSDSSDGNSISKLNASSVKNKVRNLSSEPTVLYSDSSIKSNNCKKSSETVFVDIFTPKCPLDNVNNAHSIENEEPENVSGISTPDENKVENLWIECDLDDTVNGTSLPVTTNPDLSSNKNKFDASFECLVINEENLSIKDDGILVVEPQPPRNLDHSFNFNKKYFATDIFPNNTNLMDAENSTEWSIIENDIQEEKSSETKIEAEVIPVPKPQREIFQNKSVLNENSVASPNPAIKKSIFNLSVDALPFEWSFPDYVCTDTQENKNLIESPLSAKITMSTQTEPCDFALMYKVSKGKKILDSCKYTILCGNPFTEYKDTGLDTPIEEDKICLQIVTFDKSTCTSDLIDDIEMSHKLNHLHDCFPDISIDDLTDLLEICHNDETWISNLLLEGGYTPYVQTENIHSNADNIEIKLGVSNERKGYFGFLLNKCPKVSMEKENEKILDDCQPSSSVESNHMNVDSGHVTPPSAESFQKLHLVLDPAFACQLEELFGAVSNSSSKANRCVEIDLEFAQLLHSKWKETLNCKKLGSLNNEVKVSKVINSQDQRESSNSSKKAIKEPLSLSEIMDMEYALQLHKKERLKKDTDFATKLKRLELYNMFPGADPIALDEIFESHNYSLKDCIFAIGEDIGQQDAVQLQQEQNIEKMDQCVIEWSKSKIFQEFENGDWSKWVYTEDNIGSIEETTLPVVSSTISPEATELRELATKHYHLRQEFIAKAQTAYCRGMKDVASFYAQKGNEHGLMFKDANKRASALIAQQRNMSTSPHMLDLHGLYVQEAIPALEKFLREKKLDLKRRQQTFPMTISVITGQGLHSMRGPKLRPSVVEYLRRTGYNFYEINRGMVEVTVTPE